MVDSVKSVRFSWKWKNRGSANSVPVSTFYEYLYSYIAWSDGVSRSDLNSFSNGCLWESICASCCLCLSPSCLEYSTGSKISWGLQLSLQNKENISVSVARVLLRTYTHKSPQHCVSALWCYNNKIYGRPRKETRESHLLSLAYWTSYMVTCFTPLNHCRLKIS